MSGFRKIQGFTLLELLVVIVIIGLLAGYVAPRYFSQVGKSEIQVTRAQIDELNAEMAAARAEAAAHAEAAIAEERQRADAINALLEATQEELAGQRELTDQARADAEKTHAEAQALRQENTDRKARGLVARLRAAWRRE